MEILRKKIIEVKEKLNLNKMQVVKANLRDIDSITILKRSVTDI